MSLNWNWSEKCGEAVFEQRDKEFTVNLYQGNAYLIFIYEYEEDGNNMYNLFTFWADKGHAKRCLGLEKDYQGVKYNIYTASISYKSSFTSISIICKISKLLYLSISNFFYFSISK